MNSLDKFKMQGDWKNKRLALDVQGKFAIFVVGVAIVATAILIKM